MFSNRNCSTHRLVTSIPCSAPKGRYYSCVDQIDEKAMRCSKESQVEGFEAVAPYKRTLKVLLSPRTHQTKNLSLGMTIPDPGWSGSPHSYEIEEEIWFVLSGTGLARVADDTINIEKDTSIYIPPGQPHQLVNNGSEQMRVLWVVSPPGLEESYLGKKGGRPPVDGGPPTQS